MKKESVMFGVFGLVVGLVVGFMGANSLNRSAAGQVVPAANTSSPTSASGLPNLPADHPPIGTGSGDQQQAGPLPQVMAAIDKAKAQPNDYEAQMTAADLYYQIQKFDDAAKYYEVANKLKPVEIEPMVKAGNAYFDAEKFENAANWYEKALAKNPNDISVRSDYGLTFYYREPPDLDRAIKEYKKALEIDPRHEITLQNLAITYSKKGDKEAFQATLEKLKAVNPNNPVLTKTQPN